MAFVYHQDTAVDLPPRRTERHRKKTAASKAYFDNSQSYMPHAEKDFLPSTPAKMGEQITNGERPHSLFISHLTSYPLVSDSLSAYLEHPYGKQSVSAFNDAYKRFFTPVEPYLKTPYSYVVPYLQKADSLGDKGLSEVDNRFPIVKEETSSLKEKAKSLPFVPYAFQTKDYVFKTYEEESKKNGAGAVPFVKSVIGTELRIAADTFSYLSSFLIQKKEEGSKIAHEKFEEAKKFAYQKKGEAEAKTNGK